MIRKPLLPSFLLFTASALLSQGLAYAADDVFAREIRPALEEYCLDCHDGDKPKADLNLERFTKESDLWQDPKTWERVLVQLQDKVMPPPKKKQPGEEERTKLITWLHGRLENPDEAQFPKDPGQVRIHRMSGLEYDCTMRDLLGVDLRLSASFPPDGGGGAGFDNNASTLFVPPVLMEKYLEAADTVLAAAKRERIFAEEVRDGDEAAAARANLTQLGRRAFRRPLEAREIEGLFGIYSAARQRGESYDDAVRLAAKATLVSPHFLFRIVTEREGATEPYRLTPFELATRLSYFLWSSMPDEELFRVAEEGKLQEPAVLEAQIARMLADPKARTFAENFTSQWLRTKELHTVVNPARDRFPQFTPELREALYGEAVEFFHHLLSENRSLLECLDADYTFANETLAKFYGLEGVSGEAMRRVALKDRNRGGILGMGGVLTLTSYPRRTSPVLRGMWVLDTVLGTRVPPPPPQVNTQAVNRARDGLSFRARLEAHRQDPHCAGCHARMDPLGFGLENFDAIGEWRTEERGNPVDASGQLISGQKFTGPAELKVLLLERKGEFLRNLTERMLAYALGRGVEPPDWITVHHISRTVAEDGYSARRLILEIARSFPFQYRRPSAPAPEPTIAQTQP